MHPDYPAPRDPVWDAWLPKVEHPLRSAYKAAHGGHEPDFTNWAQTRRDAAAFMGCLDYVFVSPSVGVPGVEEVAAAAAAAAAATEGKESGSGNGSGSGSDSRESGTESGVGSSSPILAIAPRSSPDCVVGPYPTAEMPSDHVPVAVDLVIDAAAPPDPFDAAFDRRGGRGKGGSSDAGGGGGSSSRAQENERRQKELEKQIRGVFFNEGSAAAAGGSRGKKKDNGALEFPATLNSYERMVVHRICEKLGLDSKSTGQKPNRFITVSRRKEKKTEGRE